MRKILASALAALTFGGAVAATASPAQAEHYGYYRPYYYGHRHHDSDDAAIAVAAGVAGLALGAALSSGDRGGRYYRSYPSRSYYYDRGYGYYGGGYYDRPYGYGYDYGPRVCISRDRVWDPYIGRDVMIERRYAC